MYKMILMLLLVCIPAFSQLITLQSPNGGEVFNADSLVEVKFDMDAGNFYYIHLSVNGGETWGVLSEFGWPSGLGVVKKCKLPKLFKTTTNALIKVGTDPLISTEPSKFDISDAPFTILATVADSETNHSYESAVILRPVDTILTDIKLYNITYDEGTFFKIPFTKATYISFEAASIKNKIPPDAVLYLYDSLKNLCRVAYVAERYDPAEDGPRGNYVEKSHPVKYFVPSAGEYYLRLVDACTGDWNPCEETVMLDLKIDVTDASVTLISPHGGDKFETGERIKVEWKTEIDFDRWQIDISFDDGDRWLRIGDYPPETRSILLPEFKLSSKTTDAKIRVCREGSDTIGIMPDSNFTIEASSPRFEPNNSFETAYLLTSQDTNQMERFFIGGDPATSDSLFMNGNNHYYKIKLSKDNLVLARPMLSDNSTWFSVLSLYDSLENVLTYENVPMLFNGFRTLYTGIYYFKISAATTNLLDICNYTLIIDTFDILSAQNIVVDTTSYQQITSSDGTVYSAHLFADSTKLDVTLSCSNKDTGSITTMVLSPGKLAMPEGAKGIIKLLYVNRRIGTHETDYTIEIPYALSDLNGRSENALQVLRWNPYENRTRWEPIVSRIDTTHQKIILHTNLEVIAFFGVVISDEAPVTHEVMTISQQKPQILLRNRCFMVNIQSPKSDKIILRLYDIKGRCIQKSVWPVTGRQTTTVKWDIGVVSKGLYFVDMIAGEHHTREAITVVR